MSYQERRAIVSFFSTLLITGIYSTVMAQRYPAGNDYSGEVFHFWGAFILILIPISIVAQIVIHIVFYILNTLATGQEEKEMTDERDRLIELKSTRNALYVFSIGFVVAMASLVMDRPPSTMFVILLSAGIASELVSDLSQFFFYRRGF